MLQYMAVFAANLDIEHKILHENQTITNKEGNVFAENNPVRPRETDSELAKWLYEINVIKGTVSVKNMQHVFCDCTELVKIDLRGLDTSNGTDMSDAFFGCRSLTGLGSNWHFYVKCERHDQYV